MATYSLALAVLVALLLITFLLVRATARLREDHDDLRTQHDALRLDARTASGLVRDVNQLSDDVDSLRGEHDDLDLTVFGLRADVNDLRNAVQPQNPSGNIAPEQEETQ